MNISFRPAVKLDYEVKDDSGEIVAAFKDRDCAQLFLDVIRNGFDSASINRAALEIGLANGIGRSNPCADVGDFAARWIKAKGVTPMFFDKKSNNVCWTSEPNEGYDNTIAPHIFAKLPGVEPGQTVAVYRSSPDAYQALAVALVGEEEKHIELARKGKEFAAEKFISLVFKDGEYFLIDLPKGFIPEGESVSFQTTMDAYAFVGACLKRSAASVEQ